MDREKAFGAGEQADAPRFRTRRRRTRRTGPVGYFGSSVTSSVARGFMTEMSSVRYFGQREHLADAIGPREHEVLPPIQLRVRAHQPDEQQPVVARLREHRRAGR